MKDSLAFKIYETAIAALEKLYPRQNHYVGIVSDLQQKDVLADLAHTIPYEQFFFVINMVHKKIEKARGLGEWLGYADASYTFFDYFKTVHPTQLESLNALAMSSIATSQKKGLSGSFMHPRVNTELLLQHRDGHYIVAKRSLYPFQISTEGQVLAYLNHFVVLGPADTHKENKIRVGAKLNLNSLKHEDAIKVKMLASAEELLKKLALTKSETKLMLYLVANPDANHAQTEAETGINANSIRKTHNHNILKKASDYYPKGFKSLNELALFLKAELMV